jgi:hypothetical protein
VVLADLGDLPAARTSYERALAIYEGHFGPRHPDTLAARRHLASVLRKLGKLPGASDHD